MALSDKDFFHLSISISKALTSMETPLKLKHARSAIISTHRTKEAKSFWAVVTKQPLMENQFTAWKFCHLLHKVLREGHANAIAHSQSHKKMIFEMGKLWGHLQDGVGICIQAYTELIVTKLNFHDKNPQFPGNLLVDFSALEKFAGDDINFYFQLGVEIFDYLDGIIALQGKVFTTINSYRMSSMTPQGQCRLAPLIPLIQDSNPLYDLSVRLMFKLHENLPNDILAGHRDRFRTVFNQLKAFYDSVRPLQYFADLIQVPHLPRNAPNFSSRVDFGSYVPPVVVVPPEPETTVENLVDVSVAEMQIKRQDTSPPNDLERLLREKNEFIQELQFEIERLGTKIKLMNVTQRDELNKMEERISLMNSQLVCSNEELANLRALKDDLQVQVQYTPTLQQKASAEEERANITEEKFNKLKTMYSQIRDEHINLLRQHADASKQIQIIKKENKEVLSENELVKFQLNEFAEKQIEHDTVLNKNSELERQCKDYCTKYVTLSSNYEELQRRFDNLQADSFAEIAELKMKTNLLQNEAVQQGSEASESLNKIQLELYSKTEECSQLHVELEHCTLKKDKEIMQLRNSFDGMTQENEILKSKIQTITAENEKLTASQETTQAECKQSLIELKHKVDELQEEKSKEVLKYEEEKKNIELIWDEKLKMTQIEHENLKLEISNKDKELKAVNCMLEKMSDEKSSLECDIQDFLHQQAEFDKKYKSSLEKIASLEDLLRSCQIQGESALRALLEACIKSSEKLIIRTNAENEFPNVANTSSYFIMLSEELENTLNELLIVYNNYATDNKMAEGLARKAIHTGHLLSMIQVQGMTACNTCADIEAGEAIAEEIKHLDQDINSTFQAILQLSESSVVLSHIANFKEKLKHLTNMMNNLYENSGDTKQLGDLVESELTMMDKAIEEAASKILELLSNSQASDSGTQLEVNERILDACTNLMQCIRVLVQKARILQSEIVALGKGTASAKEFYKRNNQWSEGLISAAKSVASGANLLVGAADKAVSGNAKHHLDIIVAAQEIAACTAQLVVSSRVKAPRNSRNLTELSSASRNVTQATGVVVATAKDCSQYLEQFEDSDLSKLTVHQAKTFEMELQVKVLELEQALQTERQRLAAFRKKNYRTEYD